MIVDGEVAGTLRVDFKPDGRAVVRLVALDPDFRRGGLGASMLEMAEAVARASGARALCVNAQPEVVGFYARQGFAPGRWEGCTACPRGVPMTKVLVDELPGAPAPRRAAAGAVFRKAA